MKLDPLIGNVTYGGLTMPRTGENALYFEGDDKAIGDWLMQFHYPPELLTMDNVNALVWHRYGDLDLILFTTTPDPAARA